MILLIISSALFAQSTANYTFSTATDGSLGLDKDGNVIDMSIATTQLYGSNIDAYTATLQDIGFNYVFMGSAYNQFSVSPDGALRFGSTVITGHTQAFAANSPRIVVMNIDNKTAPETGKVHYKVQNGTDGDVLIIEWKDILINWNATGTTLSTYQLRLYETSGTIEMVYGTMWNSATSSQNGSIWFASSNTANTIGQITTITGTPTYNSSSTTLTTTSFVASSAMINLNSAEDGSRRVFTFTPPTSTPAAPINLSFTEITATSMKVNWQDNSDSETSFLLIRATDENFTQNVTNFLIASTTSVETGDEYFSNQTGLSPVTTYYYKLQATTEGRASNEVSGSQATTPGTTYYWVGTSGGTWNTASNWNTSADGTGAERTTPATTDVLIVDGAGIVPGETVAISIVTSESVGQFKITENTILNLQSSNTTTKTITITGGPGDDFVIEAGSTLNLTNTTNRIAFTFTGTGNTGDISGTYNVAGGTSTPNNITSTGGTNTLVTVTGAVSNAIAGASGGLTGSLTTLQFASGATYTHSGYTTTNAYIPTATWDINSTVVLSGGTTSTGFTSSSTTFGNFIYNSSSSTGTFSAFTSNTRTIQGNLTIQTTNTGRFRATTSGNLTVNGDLIVNGGTFEVASTTGTVNVLGNVLINDGTFDIAQGGASTLRVAGNFVQAGGSVQQTNANGRLEFNGTTNQTFTLIPASHGTNVVTTVINNANGVNLTNDYSARHLTITNGSITGAGIISYGANSVLTYNSSTGAQTVTATEFPETGGPVSLTINNTSETAIVTLPFDRSLSGTTGVLTLTSGILDNSGYTLTLGNTAVGAVSGGTATSFVKGALVRTIPANLSTNSTYNFPIGKNTANRLELVNPLTTEDGTVQFKAEAFAANTGGTAGTNMQSLNTNTYWNLQITDGEANLTSTSVKLTDAGIGIANGIAGSNTLTGAYAYLDSDIPVNNAMTTSVLTSVPQYYVMGLKSVPMEYVSSTTTQANTNVIAQGSTNVEILGVQIVTNGNASPLNATSFTFNSNGSTSITDITNAKLYFTGTSGIFNTDVQFGSTNTDLGTLGSEFTFIGTQVLAEGTNYFWLTYDIPSNATITNVLDAECVLINVGGSARTPAITAPAGVRTIMPGIVSTYPFTDDFESGTMNNWYVVNGSQTNKWHAGTATHNGGANSAYISNNNGTSNAYTITSASVVHFYRDFQIPETGDYLLSFDWKGLGETTLYDYLRVFLVDVSVTPVAGTELSSGQIGNNYFNQASWQSVNIPIASQHSGTTKRLVFSWRNDGSVGTQPPAAVDNIVFGLTPDMTYLSSTTTQASTANALFGTQNVQILRMEVVTTGLQNPINATQFNFALAGTMTSADISSAKVYYTGASTVFSTANPFGSNDTFSAKSGSGLISRNDSSIRNINSNLKSSRNVNQNLTRDRSETFSVTGDQELLNGTNYFWLVYDVAANPTIGNTLDAICNSIVIAGQTHIPTETNPEGSRTISGKKLNSITVSQASSAITLQGSEDQAILRFLLNVTESIEGSVVLNLNSLKVTADNTSNSDIVNVKLFQTGTGTSFATTNPLGTVLTLTEGIANFTGLNYDLPLGNTNVWSAYSISENAIVNNTVDMKIAVNDINVAGNTYPETEQDPAGSRTIKAPLSGVVTVGTEGNYATLTAANGLFADINAYGLKGNLIVNIISDITEAGTNALNQWAETGEGNYTLTIRPSSATLKTLSGNYAGGLIRLNGADRVTIDGRFEGTGRFLKFSNDNASSSNNTIALSNNADNNTIRNCEIYSKYRAITLTNANGTQIIGNDIYGDVAGNTIYSQAGIFLGSNALNTTISSNLIHDFYYTSTGGWANHGIRIETNATTPTNIVNNMIYNIKADGWTSTAFFPSAIYLAVDTGNVNMYYNSIYMSGNTLTYDNARSAGITINTGVTLLDIRNNIIMNTQTGHANNKTYAIYSSSANTAFTNIDYNIYNVTGVGPHLGFIGSDQTDLNAWQTAGAKDANSKSFVPDFTSATDLSLNHTVINFDYMGTPIEGITTDIFGNLRHANAPYIGAHELTAGDMTLPVTLSSFTATITSGNFVTVTWVTESESNMVGYHLYRHNSPELVNSVRVTNSIVTAQNQPETHEYQFTDREVEGNFTYYYWLQTIELDGTNEFYGPISVKVNGNDFETPVIPLVTQLNGAYPNPFNPTTTISFDLADSSPVLIEIYNVKGQKVRTLVNDNMNAGSHRVVWDGKDSNYRNCSNGVYFYRMQTKEYNAVKKVIMMK